MGALVGCRSEESHEQNLEQFTSVLKLTIYTAKTHRISATIDFIFIFAMFIVATSDKPPEWEENPGYLLAV